MSVRAPGVGQPGPFPPPENRLPTSILAGENLPPEDERLIPLTNVDESITNSTNNPNP